MAATIHHLRVRKPSRRRGAPTALPPHAPAPHLTAAGAASLNAILDREADRLGYPSLGAVFQAAYPQELASS